MEGLVPFSTCQVADALAALGIRGHLDGPKLVSPDEDHKMCGPAHTVQVVASNVPVSKPADHHVDCAPANSVIVLATPEGQTNANWGGLLSTRAKFLGCAGVVTDGRVRDVEESRAMGFAVFARGTSVHGARGASTVVHIGNPVVIAGLTVRKGDIILGDVNGVVVVPHERLAEVVIKTKELVAAEDKIELALREGMSLREAFQAYRKG